MSHRNFSDGVGLGYVVLAAAVALVVLLALAGCAVPPS